MIKEIRRKVGQDQVEFVHCSYPSRDLVKIITLYEPDPNRWIDFEIRRRKNED